MDLLDKLVLPISGHNLNFLNYLLTLATIIFLTYAGILFGSTLLSFIYNRKAEKDKEIKYSRMSRDYIDIITSNAAFPFGLGIFPFLAIIFMYQQLLYKTEAPVVGYLLVSFLLFLLSLWLIQLYKFSLHMKSIFGFSLKSKNLDDKDFNYYDMVDFRESSERINSSTAVWGVLLLFLSMLLFIGATALAVDNARWASVTNIVILIFNEITIIKFLHFITAAFALTGVAFITKVFYWDKERIYEDEEYNNYAKKINAGLALTFILLQPIFFAINLISTPDFAISTFMFGFTTRFFHGVPGFPHALQDDPR